MIRFVIGLAGLVFVASAALSLGPLQSGPPDAVKLIAAQREAMKKFDMLDGEWRGTAWMLLPDGSRHELVQTERVGPMLDGSLKVIEGKGFEPDGTSSFNAMGIVSFDAASGKYSMRSYAMGRTGDFVVTPREDGFTWEISAGPAGGTGGPVIRYTATIKNGTWNQKGERIVPGQEPMEIFGMNLKRVGDTQWPAGDAVKSK